MWNNLAASAFETAVPYPTQPSATKSNPVQAASRLMQKPGRAKPGSAG